MLAVTSDSHQGPKADAASPQRIYIQILIMLSIPRAQCAVDNMTDESVDLQL